MENDNSPYSAPQSSLENANKQQSLEVIPATRLLRFFNLIIDYIGFFLLSIIVGIAVGVFFGDAGIEYLESVPDFALGLSIVLGYYIALESLSGRTLGKLITGTKVVNEQGDKPSLLQILGRSFSRLIPFEAFSFFGSEGRGWHDSFSKTYVVKCR